MVMRAAVVAERRDHPIPVRRLTATHCGPCLSVAMHALHATGEVAMSYKIGPVGAHCEWVQIGLTESLQF
jgi:hypothetical protein